LNACSKVSKAMAHCPHSTAGVSASHTRVMMPFVPHACRIS
jgi:hypothetical protein